MYNISNNLLINANKVVKLIKITDKDHNVQYWMTLSDGTKHQIATEEEFETIKEASGTATYSDLIVTDKLSVGDIEDVEQEINNIKDFSDVKDVVGTHAELMAYDTTTLNINDVIEVLSDETKDNKNTYYKWDGSEFDYVGGVGPFYTKPESDGKYLTNVKYENLQLKKTLNGTDSLIVDIPTLKSDLGLDNVTNDRQIKGLANGTTENDILIFGSDGYTVKDSGKSFTNSVSDAQHASDLKIATEKAIRTELDTKQNKLAEGMEAYLTDLRASMPNVDDTTIKLTYAQIKTLKDNDQLIAGRTYLITDYSTMTIDPETQSAGHDFDIVLKANTTNSFETICSAHLRAGTNYFEEQYISQWILWYNFDNNTDLCSWVDNTCKGYIYRFIDEYNNDLSYDFKNIQFKRYKIASVTYLDNYSSLVEMYLGNKSPFGYTIDDNDFVWRYTFASSDALTEDLSNKHLETSTGDNSRYVKQIKIGTTLTDNPYRGKLKLSNNVFIAGNFLCDMTFGNQTHTNTVQVINDFSYNYFGSMMRRNLIYVTDFNHNNIRECLEDNLIGSGTKMFSWNWLGDHSSHNIIQGITSTFVSGGLYYVKADSPNNTFNNTRIGNTYGGDASYSVWVTNAVTATGADISSCEIGTLQNLKLDHSQLIASNIHYVSEVLIKGRPVHSAGGLLLSRTEIYFDESNSNIIGWEFRNCRGSSTNTVVLDFRNASNKLINNAIKVYDRQIYSVNGVPAGFNGVLSYEVYDTTNNYKEGYIWSAAMDGLTPTEDIILENLTRHEVVNRIDSNYEVPDDMLIDFIDSIDTSKDHSVSTDSNVAHIKSLPSGTIGVNVNEVDGVGYKVNQLVETRNLSFDANMSGATSRKGITTKFDFISGHKYLIQLNQSATLTTAVRNIPILVSSGEIIALNNYGTSVGTLSLATMDGQNLSSGYKYCIYTCSTSISGTLAYWLQSNDVATDIEDIQTFDLTTDFGSGNEPSTVSDCATEYAKRGIDIYSYTPQQSSIKNNAFTGVKVDGANLWNYNNNIEQGTINASVGNTFDYLKGSSSARIRTDSLINLSSLQTYTLSVSSKSNATYYCLVQAFSNGVCQTTSSPFNTFGLSITFSGYSEYGFVFMKDGSNISPSDLTDMNIMLNRGSTALDYTPYIAPTTISVDLTTIKDSNNVSLFPSGKMMGNSNVADFITPTNQESRYTEVDLSQCNWTISAPYYTTTDIASMVKKPSANTSAINGVCDKYNLVARNSMDNANDIGVDVNGVIFVRTDTTPSGTLQYERATYLTSTTDLTSLTRINAQSNGTITLNNTDNVDMPNTIDELVETTVQNNS